MYPLMDVSIQGPDIILNVIQGQKAVLLSLRYGGLRLKAVEQTV